MAKDNRRKYIRISTVLPVEFFLADKGGKRITPWIQGFTSDIGKGGICLLVNDLWWGFWDKFSRPGVRVFLRLNLPFRKDAMFLEAGIRWRESKKLKKFYRYIIGLEYSGQKGKKVSSVFRFALFRKFTPIVATVLIVIFIFTSSFLFWRTSRLAKENKRLVGYYVEILQRNSFLSEVLKENNQTRSFLQEKKKKLEDKIVTLQEQLSDLDEKYQKINSLHQKTKDDLLKLSALEKKISEFKKELDSLRKKNEFLKNKIKEEAQRRAGIKKEVKTLNRKKDEVAKKVIAGMYSWIKHRQDLVRGLVLSYEGDNSLSRVCFTYDQALAAFVFMNFGAGQRAAKILDFYLNQIEKGKKIYNAYFTQGDVFEYVVHSGPQTWIGLAALNYTEKTGDKKYLKIAEEVAEFLIRMQDAEGGICGGPGKEWYSTEHNLDAYSFFNVFYRITGKRQYKETAEKIKKWIAKYAYTYYQIPVKRGKGDSTIATDTYAWSITALGPKSLYTLGMDPEAILEFAAKNCQVTVTFEYNGRKATVKGFDFAKARHAGRGGVVSGEWTSQMVLAYETMADYFKGKNRTKYNEYFKKAFFYFSQLQKMSIISPSRAGRVEPCLPYASSAFVNTGHGWRTPRGNRTGSLASTAYFLLAYKGYNPFQAEPLGVSLQQEYQETGNSRFEFSDSLQKAGK